mgnify:CR=1 FL=1
MYNTSTTINIYLLFLFYLTHWLDVILFGKYIFFYKEIVCALSGCQIAINMTLYILVFIMRNFNEQEHALILLKIIV